MIVEDRAHDRLRCRDEGDHLLCQIDDDREREISSVRVSSTYPTRDIAPNGVEIGGFRSLPDSEWDWELLLDSDDECHIGENGQAICGAGAGWTSALDRSLDKY